MSSKTEVNAEILKEPRLRPIEIKNEIDEKGAFIRQGICL